MRSLLLLLFSGVLLLALAGAAQTADPPTRPPRRVTQHQVLPFLYLRCTVCHGNRRTEGGLDLRTRTSILKGGKSGPAIVPGNPEQSRLLQRVHAGEMPPPRRVVEVSVKPMEPAEIQLVTEWIRQGAPEAGPAAEAPGGGVTERDRQFWSFRPPRRPPVPVFPGKLAPPGGTLRSPVDAFLYRELHRRGLAFAPEAGRRELIRRVTFDLTGLPPTPEEVEVFVAEPSAAARQRVVEKLLASPRFGERQ
ncbi:MAG: DUF1549 domain-containing protein, partial [Armatimonadetes bacterium]|nr:DUF1549 domain-containing protein [Armatimonadota bacterium]